MPRPTHTRQQAGFTMLEVVLAMTLLAMVTAMVYAAFHLGVRAVEKGEVALVNGQRARAATDIMSRQLKSAFPYRCYLDPEDDQGQPFFRYGPAFVEFVTAAGLQGGGGLEFVRYEGRDNQLVMTVAPLARVQFVGCGEPKLLEATKAVLLDGFSTMEFEPQGYPDDPEDRHSKAPKWNREEMEGAMPRGVRLTIGGLAGSGSMATGASVGSKGAGGGLSLDFTIVAQRGDRDEGFATFDRLFGENVVPGVSVKGGEDDDTGTNEAPGSDRGSDDDEGSASGYDPEGDDE